jgi:hypothetical protein
MQVKKHNVIKTTYPSEYLKLKKTKQNKTKTKPHLTVWASVWGARTLSLLAGNCW